MQNRVSELPKKKFYINGFAISLAVKQRLMEQLGNYYFMFVQFFESFTKITGFVEALSTSSFTALYCSVNFWILQKFPFFLICSFHKNHRFYLHFYCVSLMQWIFKCFVIFAKSVCKPGHISLDHFSATQLQLVIYGTLDPARKLAVCILVVELYPNKTKTKTTRQ